MLNRSYCVKIYALIFLLFVCSMHPWFTWNNKIPFQEIASFWLLVLFVKRPSFLELKKKNVLLVIILCMSIGFNVGFKTLFNYVAVVFIICMPINNKIECLDFITKWFCRVLMISLPLYFICLFVDLPSLGKMDAGVVDAYRDYKNYVFYVKNAFYSYRFSGMFTEPGHLGMILAFLLFANQFDFKKKGMRILLISVLCSFSLAGYLLSAIGFVFVKFYRRDFKLMPILSIMITLMGSYLFANFYNGGNNALNEKIFSRLEYSEEKGFKGNNRVFGGVDVYFAYQLKNKDLFWNGYGFETIQWLAERGARGTGFVMYMLGRGLKGVLIASMFYVFFFLLSRDKKMALLMLIFVCLMFWQRSYPYWISWIACYVFGISNAEYSKVGYRDGSIV